MKLAELDHQQNDIAREIYTVFQASYPIEAELIGTDNFPPLSRTADDIAQASTQFFGVFVDSSLAGVIELSCDNRLLSIHSLTVHPAFFRRGIADYMMSAVL